MFWGSRQAGHTSNAGGGLTWAATLAAGLALGLALPCAAYAKAAAALGYSRTPSLSEPYAACPQPTPGHAECLSIVVPPGTARSGLRFNAPPRPGAERARSKRLSFNRSGRMVAPQETAQSARGSAEEGASSSPSGFALEGSGEYGGLAPADLRSAYRLPATGGSGQTVAIVDAFNDPNAETDLQKYREKYKLVFKGAETACTEANGCFKKVDQVGETEAEAKAHSKSFPANEPGWSQEISLDLDMVSAICPECHVLLVEATNSEVNNLYVAENEAATLKATEISNSWGSPETSEETSNDKYFLHENASHERIPIAAAAGDSGYGVSYPAASKDVIAVGGTTLYKAPFYERGWFEEAWWETGSGCSAYELKEAWQTTGCGEGATKRVDDDVAAVAGTESPVSVYDSYEETGWSLFGGTSVSSPIVSAVEALSSTAFRAEGAGAFYKHPGALFDVAKGADWRDVQEKACSPEYLCTAEPGYDGPTGNGTPDLEEGGKGGLLEKWSSLAMPGYASSSTGVSCPSSTNCFSVGTEGRYAASDNWGGSEWNPLRWPFVRPSGAAEVHAPAVSCPAAGTCFAVGQWTDGSSQKYQHALAETLSGGVWSTGTVPLPERTERSYLTAISCSAATACTAVGGYLTASEKEYFKVFAERFNGSEWSLQAVSQPSDAGVSSVSCASATSCVAVGEYYNKTNLETEAFTTVWNGAEWSTHLPTVAGARSSELKAVSCTAANACTEAGWYETSAAELVTLVERWNGSGWTKQTFSRPKGARYEPVVEAVACTSATSCEAVGWTQTAPFSTASTAMAESWNGTAWTVQETPGSGSPEVRLHGLACWSTTACMATGSFLEPERFPYGGTEENLAYSLGEGTWVARPMPQVTSGSSAVACGAATECMAVGNTALRGTQKLGEAVSAEGVSQVWNGAVWTNLPVANPPGSVRFELAGIACTSPEVCTAVGSDVNEAGTTVSLVERSAANERFGAPEWSLQASPNPTGAKASSLSGVSCVSGGFCVAVGSYTNSAGTEVTLAETWNGTGWSLQASPNPTGAKASSLSGVSCVSSRFCVAVGSYTNSAGTEVTLAETWNGTEWSLQTTANPTGGWALKLVGVSCFSEAGCTAVGQYKVGSKGVIPLAEGWNGTAWTVEATPELASNGQYGLKSVSCSYATSCIAVGYEESGPIETLAEFWNGSQWAVQSTPSQGEDPESVLAGVSCASPPLCVAVGFTVAPKKEFIKAPVTNLSEVRAEPLVPPLATTEPATGIAKVQATVNGAVNPNGSETKYYFEYGTTETYGSKTAEASAGSGTSRVEASQLVTGLTAKTTYDFRIVAKSSRGTTYGANHVFTTTS